MILSVATEGKRVCGGVLLWSTGSHLAWLTGGKWKKHRLTFIISGKWVKGETDSSTLAHPFEKALTRKIAEQIAAPRINLKSSKLSNEWGEGLCIAFMLPPCKLQIEAHFWGVEMHHDVPWEFHSEVLVQGRVCDWICLFVQRIMTSELSKSKGTCFCCTLQFLWTESI